MPLFGIQTRASSPTVANNFLHREYCSRLIDRLRNTVCGDLKIERSLSAGLRDDREKLIIGFREACSDIRARRGVRKSDSILSKPRLHAPLNTQTREILGAIDA